MEVYLVALDGEPVTIKSNEAEAIQYGRDLFTARNPGIEPFTQVPLGGKGMNFFIQELSGSIASVMVLSYQVDSPTREKLGTQRARFLAGYYPEESEV